jgi:hypothetical protein
MNVQLEGAPVGIHQGMPLATRDLLACVVAAWAAGLGGLGTLAVEHGGRGAGGAPDPLAIAHDQMMVDRLPCPVIAKPGKPAIDRRGRREPVRQHLPRAAAAQHVEDRLHDTAHRPSSLASARAGRRQERRQDRPLGIGQIASIAQSRATMLRAGGRGPHEVSASGKASNTCLESHPPRPSNPPLTPFRSDSEMASKSLQPHASIAGRQLPW